MSRLDDLIQELCPDGVRCYTVDELIKNKIIMLISPTYKIKQKEYLKIGSTPIISQEAEYISGYTNLTDPRLPDDEYVCFGDHTEHIKYVDFEFVQGADGLKVMHIENKQALNAKYYYYVCSSYYLKKNTYERHFKHLRECLLPLPPLEVQQEIVRLLDDFTAKIVELQAMLNKEYEARKKQYEYYRDTLLNNNAEIPKIKLGEFAVISRGGNFQKKDFVDNGLPCIHYGQIYTHYGTYADTTLTTINEEAYSKSKKAKKNDIVMAVTSENIEDVCKSVAWLGDKDIAVSGHTAIISHHQNAKYLSYYFSSNAFFKQKKKLAHGTKVIEVTPNTLANVEVPLPSLEIQNRLVEVLDNFDSICSDLNIDLPAEIEARQKQYEYYRDSLLTFAETGRIMSQTDRQTDRQTSNN